MNYTDAVNLPTALRSRIVNRSFMQGAQPKCHLCYCDCASR